MKNILFRLFDKKASAGTEITVRCNQNNRFVTAIES
jgi:hypothetical protein